MSGVIHIPPELATREAHELYRQRMARTASAPAVPPVFIPPSVPRHRQDPVPFPDDGYFVGADKRLGVSRIKYK